MVRTNQISSCACKNHLRLSCCTWLLTQSSLLLGALLLASCKTPCASSDRYASRANFTPERQPRLRGSAELEGAPQHLLLLAVSNNSSSSSSGGNNNSDANDGDPPTAPEQIHIALADPHPREAYAIFVSWLTWEDTESQVFWGRDIDALEEVVTGNSTSK